MQQFRKYQSDKRQQNVLNMASVCFEHESWLLNVFHKKSLLIFYNNNRKTNDCKKISYFVENSQKKTK